MRNHWHDLLALLPLLAVVLRLYHIGDLALMRLCEVLSTAPARLFGRLHRLMAEGRLKWPKGPEGDILRRQVTAFTVDTSSAQPKFSGGTGAGVDDAVYALGWALEAADQRRRVARIIIPTVTDDDDDGPQPPSTDIVRVTFD